MSDSSSSRRRGVWSHWVPLAVTVTVATVGVAAWAWSQRSEESDEEEEEEQQHGLDYNTADYGDNPPYGAAARGTAHGTARGKPSFAREGPGTSYGVTDPPPEATGLAAGWGNQMSGALRRTPSPQQFLSSAGKSVAAGVAAMGNALSSIREDEKNAYADHETWSREAAAQRDQPAAMSRQLSTSSSKDKSGMRRRTVAVVVSADAGFGDLDSDDFHEHASILSHIPRNTDPAMIKLFVLIYSPGLKESDLEQSTSNAHPPSLSSSYSKIGDDPVHTPPSSNKSPLLSSTYGNTAFNAVYAQAVELVEQETMVLPFTTPNGHLHILRHLQPEVVYLQQSLAGDQGTNVTQLQSWMRHDVILVVGADGGHGGLADSESEAERPEKRDIWWQREDRVGRGRGVVVVDSLRLGDDWARRVQGKE